MPSALAIYQVLEATLAGLHLEEATTGRLLRHASRHLPLAGREEGSPFIPPLYGARVCEALGVPDDVAATFGAAGCLFFAAADLADDCADNEVRTSVGIDVNDTCALLFASQVSLTSLPIPLPARLELVQLFAHGGIQMVRGQEADLRGTDALEAADPVEIAREKSGGEFALFFAGPAVLAGQPAEPWGQFGEALGTLVQVLTDYFDLFLNSESDDWAAAKPSLPIRHGLHHPQEGAAIATLLAGDRSGQDRKRQGLWHLVRADAGPALEALVEALTEKMCTAEALLGHPDVLATVRAEIVDWCTGVVEALREYAADASPGASSVGEDLAACRSTAYRFLQADPLLEEATEVHRHGLFGADEVRGGLFGRAVALECLAGEPLDLAPARSVVFTLADADGWRYYPGHRQLPTDADCVGIMMQLATGTPDARNPAHDLGEARLLDADNQDEDGLFITWLADPGRFSRAEIDAVWAGSVCLGAAANALLGLSHRNRLHAEVARRASALARRMADPPESTFYPPMGVDYMVGRALIQLSEAGIGHGPDLAAALDHIARRMVERQRLSGRFGNVLETAQAAYILAQLDRVPQPDSVRRALIDAQAADGGYPPDPFYKTVPHPVTTWYCSRVVTTAFVLQALRALDGCR